MGKNLLNLSENENNLYSTYMKVLEIEKALGRPATGCQGVIGSLAELEAISLTNAKRAPKLHQAGYDLIHSDGTTLSVKGTASQIGTQVSININTCHLADDTIIVQYDLDLNPTILYYGPTAKLIKNKNPAQGKALYKFSPKQLKELWMTV